VAARVLVVRFLMERLLDQASEEILGAFSNCTADEASSQTLPVHLLVCGSTMVGKTALIERFVSDSFDCGYAKTTQKLRLWRTVSVAGRSIAVQIEDGPGAAMDADPEDLAECVPGPLLYQFSDVGTEITTQFEQSDSARSLIDQDDVQCPAAVIIVFNPSKRETYEHATWLLNHVQKMLTGSDCECCAVHLPVVLVANMTDLPRRFRKPECSGAAELAKVYSIPFIEASARTPKGVESVFEAAIRRAIGCQMCAERCAELQRASGNPWERMQSLLPEWLSDPSAAGGEAESDGSKNRGNARFGDAQKCMLNERDILINSRDMELPDSDDSEDQDSCCGMQQCESSVIGGKSSSLGMRRMCHEMSKKKENDEARAQVLDWRVERTSKLRYSGKECNGRSDITLSSVGRSVSGIVKDTLFEKQMISQQPPERLSPKMHPRSASESRKEQSQEEAKKEQVCDTVQSLVDGATDESHEDISPRSDDKKRVVS